MGIESGQLESHRRELAGYCYRMLASPHDAEDAVQETLLRAWRGLERFEERSGLRAWLYRIATNVCLDMLKGRRRRALPAELAPPGTGDLAMGAPTSAGRWVQPMPDALLAAEQSDPAAVALRRETVRLAFIAALQRLAPRQRAVLILRDVLSWRTREVAELLETSEDAVNGVLKRARAALADSDLAPVTPDSAEVERELLERYVDAFERYDVDALVALLHEEALVAMPPFELWLRGRAEIRRFLAAMEQEGGRDRALVTRANGRPAVAVYRPSQAGAFEPYAIMVLEVAGASIVAIHAFLDPALFPLFGLPPGDQFSPPGQS